MGRLFFKYLFFLLFIVFYSCNNKSKDNFIKECNNCSTIDSLKNANYDITNKINYFELKPYSSNINCKQEGSLFAVKEENTTINILEFSCNDIYKNRLINKYIDRYYIERQVLDNTDGGEMNYITIYYSLENIIITVISEDIFSEEPFKFYLKEVFVIDSNFVTNYTYSFNSDLHLKDENMLLSKKQLMSLDENSVKELFFDNRNVKKYQFVNENFAEKDTYIYQLFLLFNNSNKPSDVFN